MIASPKKKSATHDRQFGLFETKQFKTVELKSPSHSNRYGPELLASPKRKSATHFFELGHQKAKGGSDTFSRPVKYVQRY